MPLDPRIALGTQVPQAPRPLQTLGALARLREQDELNTSRQLQNEQRRREIEDDDAIRSALQENDNPDSAIDRLYQAGRAEAAGLLSKNLYAQRKAKGEEVDRAVKTQKEQVGFAAQILQSATDQQSWDSARTAAQTVLPPELFQHVPPLYDPAKQKQLVDWGTTVGEKLTAQQNAIANANKAWDLSLSQARDWREREEANRKAREYWSKSASSLLSTAHSQEEWDGHQRMLANSGAPVDLLAEYGNQFSPQAVEKAKTLGMSPTESSNAAHQTVTERQGQANVDLRRREVEIREAEAGTKGGGGKPLTQNRMSEIAEYKQRQYAALEKDLREDADNFDETGTFRIAEGKKAETAKRKLAIEDGAREMQGQPPLLATEHELASQPGKEKELRKIRNVYRSLTGGQDTPLERMGKLAKQIKAEKDPKKAADLKKELKSLYDAYGSLIGQSGPEGQ